MTATNPQPNSSALAAPAVLRLLISQRDLYLELDELSRRQAELINEYRTDELLQVLGTRQSVLERIQTVNDALAPVRARWSQFLATLDAVQRREVSGLVNQMTELISGVAQRDQADRDSMIHARERVADELTGLDRSRRATSAYGSGPGGGGPLFQDREA